MKNSLLAIIALLEDVKLVRPLSSLESSILLEAEKGLNINRLK